MNNVIKKLIRKMPDGKWWYTLRWTSEKSYKDGACLESTYCFDSKPYLSYRECISEASKNKKIIQKWEADRQKLLLKPRG